MPFSKLSHNAKKAWRKVARSKANVADNDIRLVERKFSISAPQGAASSDENLESSVTPVLDSFSASQSIVTGIRDEPGSPVATSFTATGNATTDTSHTRDSSDGPSSCRLSSSGESLSTAPSSLFADKLATPSLRAATPKFRPVSTYTLESTPSLPEHLLSPTASIYEDKYEYFSEFGLSMAFGRPDKLGTVRLEEKEYDRCHYIWGDLRDDPRPRPSLCSSIHSSVNWPLGNSIYDEPGLVRRRINNLRAAYAITDAEQERRCPHVCQSIQLERSQMPLLYKGRKRLNNSICEVENDKATEKLANAEPSPVSRIPSRIGFSRWISWLTGPGWIYGYDKAIDVNDLKSFTEYCPSFDYFPPGSVITSRLPDYCNKNDYDHPFHAVDSVYDPLRGIPIGGAFEDREDWHKEYAHFAVCA